MADSFTVDIDGTQMRDALEGDSLKSVIRQFVNAASKVSADRIAAEAKARLSRQLSGSSTGQTLAGIVVKTDRTGWGWIVTAGNKRMPMLDVWIEFGTKQGAPRSHTAAARPFFYDSARIEESAHQARVSAAIQAALSEFGLAGEQR